MTTTPTLLRKFRQWTREADYGQEFVYSFAADPRDARDPVIFEYARKLSEGGLAFLYQRRRAGGFDYVARRTRVLSHEVLDRVSESIPAPIRKERPTCGRPRKGDESAFQPLEA